MGTPSPQMTADRRIFGSVSMIVTRVCDETTVKGEGEDPKIEGENH